MTTAPGCSAEEQLRRLRLFLAAYKSGLSEAEVIAAAIERQTILVAEGTRSGNTRMSGWAADCREWIVRHMTAG